MIRVGITGQTGFVGTHLVNKLQILQDNFQLVNFEKEWLEKPDELARFVKHCDCIVHLAAMNRHNDPQVIYDTNIRLVEDLMRAMEESDSTPRVIFSSSTQENRENLYGKSKRDGRKLLARWAENNGGTFSGLVIPNVFGPFGDPFYNSVVATFSHQLTNGQKPEIHKDSLLKLIYVGELVDKMITHIRDLSGNSHNEVHIPHTSESNVSELLDHLRRFRDDYFIKGVFPALKNRFEMNLFNTFRSYIDHENHFPITYQLHSDDRGSFVETIHLKTGGQVSFSTTVPGVTRGNHFHTRKIERFAVIKGNARIEMRQIGTDEVLSFNLSGETPGYVDMPVWYTHNITNTGDDELYTLFWISEFYDPNDADTFYEDV